MFVSLLNSMLKPSPPRGWDLGPLGGEEVMGVGV